MATQLPIQSSGLFRSAYRMKISEGTNAQRQTDPGLKHSKLTQETLSDLIQKAQLKWPKSQFEFRLIDKRDGTYLEVLKQKKSTLSKDAKNQYTKDEQGRYKDPIQARDQRRMAAAYLLADKDLLNQNGIYKYRAREAQQSEELFARSELRGKNAADLFNMAVEKHDQYWTAKLATLDPEKSGSSGAVPVRQASSSQLEEQDHDDAIPPAPQLTVEEQAQIQLRNQRLAAGKVLGEALDKVRTKTQVMLAQPHSVGPGVTQAAMVQLPKGKGSALKVERTVNGQREIRYHDKDALKGFARSQAFQPAPRSEAITRMQDVSDFNSLNNLRSQIQQAVVKARQDQKSSPEALWTTPVLKNAVNDASSHVMASFDRRGRCLEEDGLDLASHTASKTLAQLDILAYLGAYTLEPQARAALVEQHQQLSQALITFLSSSQTSLQDIETVRQQLDGDRRDFAQYATRGDLDNHVSRVAEKLQAEAQAKLDANIARLKKLPTRDDYEKDIGLAKRYIAAKAQLRMAKRADPVPRGLFGAKPVARNKLHITEAPPRDLSRTQEWEQLCNFTDAVNNLRKEGRAGFSGYGFDEKVPDKVVADQFNNNAEIDPVVATQIISTMRKLMESSQDAGGQDAKIYMPSTMPGKPGEWLSWNTEPVIEGDKGLPLAVAQLLELEFVIAHAAGLDKTGVDNLHVMHQQIANHVNNSQAQRIDGEPSSLIKWVNGSAKRVNELVAQYAKDLKKQTLPQMDEVIYKAVELGWQARDAHDKNVEFRQAQAQKVQTQLSDSSVLDVAFPPANAGEALNDLFNPNVDLPRQAAATSHLIRLVAGRSMNPDNPQELRFGAQARQTLAYQLADRMQKSPSVNIDPALRFLAGASNHAYAPTIKEAAAQDLRKALQAQGVYLEDSEQKTAALLDNARFVHREELTAHLSEAIDPDRLQLLDVVQAGDSQADVENLSQMGGRFAVKAQEHFDNAGESRPLATILMVKGNHWVGLIAHKGANGQVAYIVTDTDHRSADNKTPSWFSELQTGLTMSGRQTTTSFVGTSLQDGRAANACGVLQSMLLQSLQRRDPSQPVDAHVRNWMKDGGLAQDDEAATWQIRAERAQMMQAVTEAGLAIANADQLSADTAIQRTVESNDWHLNQLDQIASNAEPGELAAHPTYQKSLETIATNLSTLRKFLGDLKLFDASGAPIGRLSLMQLDQADVLHKVYALKADPGMAGLVLESLQTAYANALERGNSSEIQWMEDMVNTVQQEERFVLLKPDVLAKERQVMQTANVAIGSVDALAQLSQQLLPNLDAFAQDGPDAMANYLACYPQRAPNVAMLAEQTQRLGSRFAMEWGGPTQESQGLQHDAFLLWSALAASPWIAKDGSLATRAAQGMQSTQPIANYGLETIYSEADQAVDLDEDQAQQLREGLNAMLNREGLGDLVIKTETSTDLKSAVLSTAAVERKNAIKNNPTLQEMYKAGHELRVLRRALLDPPELKKFDAKTLDEKLCNKLFVDNSKKKTFFNGKTYDSYKDFPNLKPTDNRPAQIVDTGYLILLQMMRPGESKLAEKMFKHFIDKVQNPTGDEKYALDFVRENFNLVKESQAKNPKATKPVKDVIYEVPKIKSRPVNHGYDSDE